MRSFIASLELDLLSVGRTPPILPGFFGMSVQALNTTFMPLFPDDCLYWSKKYQAIFYLVGLPQLYLSKLACH